MAVFRDFAKRFPEYATGIGVGMACAGDHPKYLWVGGAWFLAGLLWHMVMVATGR